jgi:MFS family permease
VTTTGPGIGEGVSRAELQRRTVRTLVWSQVLAGGTTAGVVTIGSLLAKEITDTDSLAGTATAALTLGTALAALPLARHASKVGRRPVLAGGFAVGGVGALAVGLAAAIGSYPLLLVGMAAVGIGQAAGLQARFAAADLADDAGRAGAIGTVVWAMTVGSVAAPNLLGPSSRVADSLGLEELAGLPIVGVVLAFCAALFVAKRLRPDPLVEAGGLDAPGAGRRPLRPAVTAIRTNLDAAVSLASVVVAHATMVGVMSMTAIHLDDGGQSKAFIGFVISTHIAGMYAFSPVAGRLADRIGRVPTLALGAAVLVLATDTAGHSHGSESVMMLLALFALGFGWSLALVAGSALLTESVSAEVRVSAQGLSDVAMSASGAIAAVAAGFVVDTIGYHHLSHVGMGLSSAMLAVAIASSVSNRRVIRAAV